MFRTEPTVEMAARSGSGLSLINLGLPRASSKVAIPPNAKQKLPAEQLRVGQRVSFAGSLR